MFFWTIQTIEAWEILQKTGMLCCNRLAEYEFVAAYNQVQNFLTRDILRRKNYDLYSPGYVSLCDWNGDYRLFCPEKDIEIGCSER